jgi:hypothetical protein
MSSLGHFLVDYGHRHAHPVNAFLHILGVPAAFSSLYFFASGRLTFGLALLVIGYFLQYLGHEAQGNEVGEVTLIKSIYHKVQKSKHQRKTHICAEAANEVKPPDLETKTSAARLCAEQMPSKAWVRAEAANEVKPPERL